MAGKVLKEEDFSKSGDPNKEDTSQQLIPADQKMDQDGNVIVEEPVVKETPKEDKGGDEPQPKLSDEFKPKHKTWEETEKARVELEREHTKKAMRLSETEKELSQYKKPPEKPKTLDDQIREITKATLDKIRLLPADSPTRDDDGGYLWAKLQGDIYDLKTEERSKRTDTEREIVTKTYERAQKEGIGVMPQNPTPSDRAKSDAELRILGFEFSRLDPSLNVDNKIEKAIENTKGVLTQIRDGFIRDQEKDKKDKDDLKVLGRGSTRKVTTDDKEKKPTTMSQQLAELNEKRKMTKEDLRY